MTEAAPHAPRDIVCLSTMSWEGLWTRKQRFMRMLAARGHRVLYVEPVSQPLARFVAKDRVRAGWTARLARPDAGHRLYVLTPPFGLPYAARHPLPFRWNRRVMQRAALAAMCRLGMGADALVWTYLPWHPGLMRPRHLVYDCVDEHAAYPGVNAAMIRAAEAELLDRADLVFVTAQGLREGREGRARRLVYLPNGVDAAAFAAASGPPPEDLARLPRPIAGYVGAIYAWIDLDLLAAVARARPGWSFVLIGPTDQDLGPLLALGNVYHLGPRPRDRVPAYVRHFDVGLNPFRLTELARHVNPLKVYEYLAAGIPVVSTDMPEVRRLGDVVRIASDPGAFAAALDAAAAEGADPARAAARRAVAWEHDWGALFRRALEAVEEAAGIAL